MNELKKLRKWCKNHTCRECPCNCDLPSEWTDEDIEAWTELLEKEQLWEDEE